jgi:hypothetical protein
MLRFLISALLFSMVFAIGSGNGYAQGQTTSSQPQAPASPPPTNSKVKVWSVNGDGGYRAVKTAAYADIRSRLQKRKVLEEFGEFLSPLRLPYTLWVYTSECDGGEGASPYYDPDTHAINMCYQFVALMENIADKLIAKKPAFLAKDLTRDDIVTGMFVAVIMHETGHGVFDLLNVPVFGREEDAADQMAAFIAVQFDKNVARTVINGFAYLWAALGNPPTKAPDPNVLNPAPNCSSDPFCAFSDVHGTSYQRMYNALCLAYGSDKTTFNDFVVSGWLPKERAQQCSDEYQQLKVAFAKTVYPFIDEDLMKVVLAHNWLKPAQTQ